MSFLLDALRKSERNARLGEVPTIHQAGFAAPDDQAGLHRGWLAATLLLALVCLVGLFWRQYAQPQPEQVVAEPAGSPAINAPAIAKEEQAGAQAPSSTGTFEPALAPETAPAMERTGPRTPMEALQASSAETDVQEDAQAGEPEAMPEPEMEMEPEARPQPPAVVTAREVPNPDLQAAINQAAAASARAAPEQRPAAHEPSPITYWQLPDNIRSQLPPMKISVLVYAEHPDDRFALVDGRRRRQGDEVAPGLDVLEIRRDGVLMSYQAYHFLVRN
jgi:general secretion pathway protein B